MLEVYRRKLIIGLMTLLVLFFLIVLVALMDLRNGRAMFNTGIDYRFENIFVIILSVLSMIKVIHEIHIIEHY